MAKAKYLFRTALSGTGNTRPSADRQIMKNFNGSDCIFNSTGYISEFKDSEGRCWKFAYDQEQVVAFVDPQAVSWKRVGQTFVRENGKASDATPNDVLVNHSTGEVTVIDDLRVSTYKPDGSTVIRVEQMRNGERVRVTFIEHATRPHRAFVVIEERGGREQVTWIQDANAKLFKFDYDAAGNLWRYTDVSGKPPVIWTAELSAKGEIVAWNGVQKDSGLPAGTMVPMLVALDLSGNRHFVRPDGVRFIVGPSGAACMSSHANEEVVSGKSPVVTFSTFPTFSTEQR